MISTFCRDFHNLNLIYWKIDQIIFYMDCFCHFQGQCNNTKIDLRTFEYRFKTFHCVSHWICNSIILSICMLVRRIICMDIWLCTNSFSWYIYNEVGFHRASSDLYEDYYYFCLETNILFNKNVKVLWLTGVSRIVCEILFVNA